MRIHMLEFFSARVENRGMILTLNRKKMVNNYDPGWGIILTLIKFLRGIILDFDNENHI